MAAHPNGANGYYPRRWHCNGCGKNLGQLTPPFAVKCRRCGVTNVVDPDERVTLPDPRVAVKK